MISYRRRFALRTLVLLPLALAACDVTTGPDANLDSARQTWALKHPSSYDMVVQRSCFCGTEVTSAVLISVREGVVTSRTYVGTGATVKPAFAGSFPNVEGLFLIADDALARHAFKAEITYDPALGYPTSMNLDYAANTADDELTVSVSNFVAR